MDSSTRGADTKVVASLPVELAEDLASAGHGTLVPVVRSGGPISADLIVSAAQVAVMLISFAQVPSTLAYLANSLSRWRRTHGNDVALTIRSARGRLDLSMPQDVSSDDVQAMLR